MRFVRQRALKAGDSEGRSHGSAEASLGEREKRAERREKERKEKKRRGKEKMGSFIDTARDVAEAMLEFEEPIPAER